MHRCTALVTAALVVSAVAGGAEVIPWQVGQGGLSWDSQGLIEAAVDLSAGFVQPSGFTDEDNIVGAMVWEDVGGTPANFTTEGQGRVWSNVAGKTIGQDLVMVDGDSTTSTGTRFKSLGVRQTGRIFNLDLGASFPAQRIVFYPSPQAPDDFLRGYELRISDGRDYDQKGQPKYVRLRLDDLNREPRVVIDFPPQLLRFIELRVIAPNSFEIAEIEVYGQGFVPRAQYLSQFIDLGAPMNLGDLQVAVEQIVEAAGDDPASVSLQVRNGTDLAPTLYFEVDPETQDETVVDQATYEYLNPRRRTQRYDSEHWSAWSEPLELDTDGTYSMGLASLPGPRQYFQFRLDFQGTSGEVMRVANLDFTYSPPLARNSLAEVALRDEPTPLGDLTMTPTGEMASFVYSAVGVVGPGDGGFDGIHVATPVRPQFLSLSLGERDNTLEPDSLAIDDDGLRVYFPSRRAAAGDSVAVWVTFETTPLLYSTLFSGWLLDTSGDLPQPLEAGDVGPQISTNSLLVFGSLGTPLSGFELSTDVVTPNDDGRNDVVAVGYDIIFLVGPAQVEVAIWDLAGHRVRTLFSGRRASGRYSDPWDGTDGQDAVAPGHYICTVSVETQNRTFQRARLLAVAY